MIALPPLEVGGEKVTTANPLPGAAAPMFGAPGATTLVGVTVVVADGGLEPTAFLAVTEQV